MNFYKKIENNRFYYTASNIVMQTMQEIFLTKHGDDEQFFVCFWQRNHSVVTCNEDKHEKV